MIAETDGSGATLASYTYDSSGTLFSMTRDGATYYYHLNARGDVVALSDSTGAVVNTYSYDPWGTLLTSSETVANPYRYASYRYDAATGLYYCWNRYYAPEFGRFLTRDVYPGELSDPVTMNPYLYCGGDPVNRVDPTGMWSATATLGVIFGVAAVAASVAAVVVTSPVLTIALGVAAVAAAVVSLPLTQFAYSRGEMSKGAYQVTMGMAGVGLGLGAVSLGASVPVALGIASKTGGCAGVATATGMLGAETGLVATLTGVCSSLRE